jgi:SAM-dependent methyltransferase
VSAASYASDVGEWWESFFETRWAGVQLDWAGSTTDEEVDRIEERLRLEPASDVLDVPCGEGRIGRRLAARGHRVTGVDLTERFIEEGRHRAAADGVELTWVRGDMRRLAFEAEFDAAVNYWGSLGYFEDEGNRAFVAGVARALRPGGRLLIETLTLETLLPEFSQRMWQRIGETLVLQESRFDHERGRVDTEWTLIAADGTRDVRDSSIRVYCYAELTALLREVGFTSFEGVDTASGEPFGLGADRLTLVATRG